MAPPDRDALVGSWSHSHEEDSDDEMVFRPATGEFPPSRGRASFEFRPDGSYVERSPGPVDAPEVSGGRWSLEGDRLVLEADGDRPGHAWELTGAGKDRLTVRKS
jgi:hypothetical protein